MEYFYKGLDAEGNPTKAMIEAITVDEAKKKLKAQGILYSQIGTRQQSFLAIVSFFDQKEITSIRLSVLSRDLAVYLKAGVPLVRSLSLMKHQSIGDVRMERFLDTVITSIHEGKSFAQALEQQEYYKLPIYYTGTLKISEDRGILAEVLNELSLYLTLQEKIKKQLRQAMVYPSFIIVASVLMISFMLSVVVPKITAVFETTGQALPLLTRSIINMADFFSAYWFLLLLGGVALSGFFLYKMATDQPFKYAIHHLVLKLPIIGTMIQTGDLARFSTISALLMRSGIPIVNTVKLSCITLSSEVMKSVFEEASTKVVEGSSLSKALSQNLFFSIDRSFIEAIAIGEETSEVPSMLEHLSALYVETNKDKIGLFLAVLEPTLMLFIGSIIGVIVTAMLLPIFSLNIGE
jgi:general secretion pathway protein F/type IV pilus assembly protein PilC